MNRAPRPGHPRERPVGNRDPNHDLIPAQDRDRAHARVHRPNPDRGLDRARILDHARAPSRVRRPSRAANRGLDPAVLSPGIRRDLGPSRDRARERLRSHRRDLGRVRDPSPDRDRGRDPPLVAVAAPPARAAKAARKASESRSVIDNTLLVCRSLPFEPSLRRILVYIIALEKYSAYFGERRMNSKTALMLFEWTFFETNRTRVLQNVRVLGGTIEKKNNKFIRKAFFYYAFGSGIIFQLKIFL